MVTHLRVFPYLNANQDLETEECFPHGYLVQVDQQQMQHSFYDVQYKL